MNYPPKARKLAPPPPYIAVVPDVSRSAESDENNLLGEIVYHHDSAQLCD
ncbi:MAG: hypothetical protein ACE1S7_02870 [Candidatus Tisiphia sp.]